MNNTCLLLKKTFIIDYQWKTHFSSSSVLNYHKFTSKGSILKKWKAQLFNNWTEVVMQKSSIFLENVGLTYFKISLIILTLCIMCKSPSAHLLQKSTKVLAQKEQ